MATAKRGVMAVPEKISNSVEKKVLGNEFFKAGDIQKAIKRYHIALLYIKDIEKPSPLDKLAGLKPKPISENEMTEIKKLRSTCYNNLAACFMKKKNYDKIIDYATKALENDDTNIKALFRRGQAYYNSNNVDKADDDFKEVKRIQPNETCVDSFFPLIDAARKQQLGQEKLMYRRMMEGTKT